MLNNKKKSQLISQLEDTYVGWFHFQERDCPEEIFL